MIINLNFNQIKIYEWGINSYCGGLLSGLITMSQQNRLAVVEKGKNLFYKIPMSMLLKELPILKSSKNIMKCLRILEAKGLIVLDIEEFNINYMFTEKGSTWLILDFVAGKKIGGKK